MLITERPPRRRAAVHDLIAVGACAGLVVLAAVVGWALLDSGVDIYLGFPPLLAAWMPHVGPGTPVALVVAVLVVRYGPPLAGRMRWRPLLTSAYCASLAWTLSLALVDGWERGVAGRLTTSDEYLHDVPGVTDIPGMLRTFADHILTTQVDPAQTWFWTTHVGAHPPAVFLLFVWLDRIGLGGGGPAGLLVVLIGSSACVGVAVAMRALDAERFARRALPFGVLLPGAVWVGVSADGMFAGVLAWSIALLAIAASTRGGRSVAASASGGLLFGVCLYLSYGLVIAGLLPLAVVLARRAWRIVVPATAGVVLVVAVFTASGFWWFTGFAHLRVIYAASIASTRPYWYFVWADLAAVLFAMGPAIVAALRRAVTSPAALPLAAMLLPGAALAAILLADLSGMSKAEVERIWLPFVVWLVPLCALLPRRRAWLVAQAVLALAVNHLLLTVW
ncbi:hypothetical protein [Pseudonocardia spinosispora]|uniref:hypothetical protein n=1 Tax=Pseudonocardia spinosispora TaxID=103441 RepID=UPI000683F0D7|nr:hypothetical protein [Pseudonocardia spinosispora]